MEKKKLDRIIEFIKEQMVVGNTGYTSKGDQTRAGFDPVQGKMLKRRKYIKLPPGSRKRWMKKDES